MVFKNSRLAVGKWMLIVLAAVFLLSCSAKLDESQVMERNGLLYEKGSDKPFSGLVTGKSRHEGYRAEPFQFKKEYKNGRLDGRCYYYYLNGKIESIEPYEKGILNGVVTRYYENGQIKARVHFVDGFRGGSKGEMFWNEDGTLQKG